MSFPFPLYQAERLRASLSLEDLIEPVADAFIAYSRGEGDAPVAVFHLSQESDVHVKSAYLRGHAFFVIKVATWFGKKIERGEPPGRGFIAVCDAQSGDLVAFLQDEHYLSDLRTAAAGAVAARLLAPAHIQRVGVLGTGAQAYYRPLALAHVRSFEALLLWGRHRQKALDLAQRLQEALPQVRIDVAPTPEAVVHTAEVIITTTASQEPLIQGAWLRPGQHITAVGADDPFKCELASSCLLRADRLIVDSRAETARHGDVYRALTYGDVSMNGVHGELGQVLAGTLPGRRSADDITIVKLIGLGIQDLAAAEVALQKLQGGQP